MESNDEIKHINNSEDLECLIKQIANDSHFAMSFKFCEYKLFQQLLNRLGIDYAEFKKTYFYFDNSRNLHISESEFKYVWISTLGLVAKGKSTRNQFVNSCTTQYTVISLLIEKSIEVCENQKVYDIDGYNFGQLNELTPALFHNLLFYLEIFGKAYLSLTKTDVPRTHRLATIYDLVTKTMYSNNHNNSLFQVQLIDEIIRIVKYVSAIPGRVKEEYIKYDDNPNDSTVIIFNSGWFRSLQQTLVLCHDFIYDFYREGNNSLSLKTGLLERLLEKCKTEDEKKNITKMYGHLLKQNI
jgi:hypothetical protein